MLYDLYGFAESRRGYSVPRLEEGYRLEAIRRRIAARAGIAPAAVVPGEMVGHVERLREGELEGWVMDRANPANPIELEVLVDGEIVATVLANRYRPDLDRAGLADGRCAFAVVMPAAAKMSARSRCGAPAMAARSRCRFARPSPPESRAAGPASDGERRPRQAGGVSLLWASDHASQSRHCQPNMASTAAASWRNSSRRYSRSAAGIPPSTDPHSVDDVRSHRIGSVRSQEMRRAIRY